MLNTKAKNVRAGEQILTIHGVSTVLAAGKLGKDHVQILIEYSPNPGLPGREVRWLTYSNGREIERFGLSAATLKKRKTR